MLGGNSRGHPSPTLCPRVPITLFSKVKIWRGELKTSGLHGNGSDLIFAIMSLLGYTRGKISIEFNCVWKWVPWSPEVFNSPRQILTLLNKVPGYWLQGKTDLANKPRNLQIFPHSKFGINRTAASAVMAKKYNFGWRNFLAITFKPAVRLIPNFECGKICKILGLFAKSVSPWSQ